MEDDIRLTNTGDSQSSGYDTSSHLTIQSQERLKRNKKGVISKIVIIISFFLVIIIITMATILAAERHKSSTEHKSCQDGWIGYLGKCFYFSENTTTWAASQNFCVSHAATLAVFHATEELDFLKRYSDYSQYWIGLSRKPGETWRWIDGTIYSGWYVWVCNLNTGRFEVTGTGECAYLHKAGTGSSSSHLVRKWICSTLDTRLPRS